MNRSEIFDVVRKLKGSLSKAQVKAGDEIMDAVGEKIVAEFLGMENINSMLTEEKLKKIYPNADTNFLPIINALASKYGINTKERMAMFLAQVIHESGGFKKLRESLAYSPERLVAVFPNRFKTVAQAKAVTSKGQVAIGDSIYGGRMGNGTNNGDGYKYRGGGLTHTTGKTNYTLAQNALIEMGTKNNLVSNPDEIVKPEIAVETAMIFWRDNKINAIADTLGGSKDPNKIKDVVTTATKKVNGGTNGLTERLALFNKALNVL